MSDHEISIGELPHSSQQTGIRDLEKDKDEKELRVLVSGNKEKESDVAKDEKKDTEKPLLDNKDRDEIVTLKLEIDGGKDGDTPTLPLPERKSKHAIAIEDAIKKDPPSMFLFPVARIKYAWDNSENLLEFFTRTICILFASLGWMILVGGVPLFSVVQLVMGCVYLHDCPAQPLIPEYLIVAGFFGTLLHFVAICTKYVPKKKRALFEAQRRRCLCLEAIVQIFLVVWFIAGCFWVYTIYEPEYKIKEHPYYCHKVVYLFTFWMFNIAFLLLTFVISMGICCIAFIAMGSAGEPSSE